MNPPSTHPQRVDAGTELLIDALRGIAALMVFGTHAMDLAISQVHGWDLGENPPFWRFIRAVFGTGEHWVWCFFVISGFCIHLSIARSVRENRFQLGSYALARITRIYPLYLAGFALAILTWWLVPHIGGFDGHLPARETVATLFSLQIFTNAFPSYEASWSLSCEMIFYGVWPALLLVAGLRERRALYLGMVGTLLVAAVILVLWSRFDAFQGRAFVDGFWTLSVLFVLWLAGAWLAADWAVVSKRVTFRLWITGVVSFAVAVAFLFTLRYLQYPPWSVHAASWGALPGIVILIAGARHARLEAVPEKIKSACRWLGQLSYPCYVLHVQLLHLADAWLCPLLPESLAAMPLVRAALYAIAVLPPLLLLGPPLERALMSWRARVLRGAPVRAVAAAV